MPTTPHSVLILGANGRFGHAAVLAFAAAGWRVLAQVRRAPALSAQSARYLYTPLTDTAALAAQAHGVRAVVYAVNPPYTDWPAQVLPLARLGMDVAQQLGATFMLPGNVYNFGAAMPALLTESTAEAATTAKGRIRSELEAEMKARAAGGLRSVVLRAGDFFGAGQGNWFDTAVTKSLARGKLVYPGPLDVPHAWAYLPDFARAFVAVAEQPAAAACERLHFEGFTLTGRELLEGIAAAAAKLGLRPAHDFAHGSLPWRLIRLGGLVKPMWRELAEMAYLWQRPHALSGTLLLQRVGALPGTPLALALQRSLVEMGLAASPRAAAATA